MKDILKVDTLAFGAIMVHFFTDLNTVLTTIALFCSIVYTIYKFTKEKK